MSFDEIFDLTAGVYFYFYNIYAPLGVYLRRAPLLNILLVVHRYIYIYYTWYQVPTQPEAYKPFLQLETLFKDDFT